MDRVTHTPVLGTLTDFRVVQGQAVAKAIQLFPREGGEPLDLGGYSLRARILFPEAIDLSTESGGLEVAVAASGVAILRLPPEATIDVPPGGYPYDLWSVSADGTPRPELRGRFVVLPRVPTD